MEVIVKAEELDELNTSSAEEIQSFNKQVLETVSNIEDCTYECNNLNISLSKLDQALDENKKVRKLTAFKMQSIIPKLTKY